MRGSQSCRIIDWLESSVHEVVNGCAGMSRVPFAVPDNGGSGAVGDCLQTSMEFCVLTVKMFPEGSLAAIQEVIGKNKEKQW
jgi:hypothetical protein